jgi:tryptophanyl-tRNA synthetase
MSKKRLVSGIQASGRLHIGNYLGAMRQFVLLQDDYDAHIFVANYHSLTTVQDKETLERQTMDVVLDYLAIGLDPEKVTLYTQTSVPQLFELTWIFNTLVTMPWLERAHAFKDKEAKGIEASVGLFDYPVLQAADIMLPGAHIVPVGEDQRQHIEMAREIARKFNNQYGDTFIEPEELIKDTVAVVPGTDGEKMSKSYGNTIPLFGTDAEIKKAVMGIVTDSKGPDDPKNPDDVVVYQIYKLIAPEKSDDMRAGLEAGGLGYGEAKKMLLEAIIELVTPMRERREQYAQDMDAVKAILEAGGKKVYEHAEAVMQDVRNKVGLI